MNPALPPARPTLVLTAFLTALVLLSASASAGSAAAPEVTDSGVAEQGLPPYLDLISGWVFNETSTSFTIAIKAASLVLPANRSLMIHYHFHFQLQQTDGATALYHAMVHHLSPGGWNFMVQRWISVGGTGEWGETNLTGGHVDEATGVIQVLVLKSFVRSPKVDLQKNTWKIERFYIHADEVNSSTGAVLASDAAPDVGTMGEFSLTLGTPVPQNSPAPGVLLVVGALGAAAVMLVRASRRKLT